MQVEWYVDGPIPLDAYYLVFAMAWSRRSNKTWTIKEAVPIPMMYTGEITVQNWLQLDHSICRLHEGHAAKRAGLPGLRQQLRFEELVYTLMEAAEENAKNSDWAKTMEYFAGYMAKHYSDNIKIDSMSRMCGMNPSTFSRLFKKHTGMLPSDYLTHIRIQRAKELLLQARRIREVAQRTGFCDEYYFSRMFKKVVGISPSFYAKKSRSPETGKDRTEPALEAVRVAVTYIDEVDHLIALGLLPLAVPNDHREDCTECTIPYLQEQLQHVQQIGCEDSIRKDLLLKLHPDMIIACRYMREWGITGLEHIASTHYYSWEVDWRNTHRELAIVLGQEDRAERNIARFDRQVKEARHKMHRSCLGKKFVFLEMTRQGIRVSPYTSNGGWLLFQQLGFTPAPIISANNWDHLISPEEAAEIDADYVLFGRRSSSRQTYNQFIAHSARRKHQLLEVPRYPWAKGGPIAYASGIDYVVSLFEKIHK
jgi:AraC-like DNA-binding protein/ABC-type Fe3+-citrate transport system substrate-binding protein